MTLAGLTPPTFESDRTGNQFWVTMLFHHFLTPEDWNWLTRFTDQNLTNEESRALVFVREAGAIKNQTYRDLNSVDTLNASNHLRKLRDRGLLEMKGKGAETYYIPTETLLEGWQSSYRSQSESAITQAGNLALETGKPASEAGNLPDKTGNLTTEAGKLTSEPQAPAHGNLKNDSLNTVPSKLAEDIRDLPKKASQQTMQDLIERLCRVRDWNLDELAQHFQRNRQYTLDKYVTPMVRDGRLVMIFPDQPNHPKQRYRSKTVETE